MRVTTSGPKSGGRVIIRTGADPERIYALGLILDMYGIHPNLYCLLCLGYGDAISNIITCFSKANFD